MEFLKWTKMTYQTAKRMKSVGGGTQSFIRFSAVDFMFAVSVVLSGYLL